MAWWTRYQVQVPPGEAGLWRVVVQQSTRPSPTPMGPRYNWPGRTVPAGRYTVLQVLEDAPPDALDPFAGEGSCFRWRTVMADSAPEIRDGLPFMRRARGHVLIFGLGLGMVPRALLRFYPRVERVTVVERSPDVLQLVLATYGDLLPRLDVVQGDAFTWTPPPGARFDACWSDIWNTFSDDNLPQMQQLRRRYRDVVHGPHFAWAEELCELIALAKACSRGHRRRPPLARAIDTIRAQVLQRSLGRP